MKTIYLNETKIVTINRDINPNINNGIHLFNPSLNKGIIRKKKTKEEPMSGCKKIKKIGKLISKVIFNKSDFFDKEESCFDKYLHMANTVPNFANSASCI